MNHVLKEGFLCDINTWKKDVVPELIREFENMVKYYFELVLEVAFDDFYVSIFY